MSTRASLVALFLVAALVVAGGAQAVGAFTVAEQDRPTAEATQSTTENVSVGVGQQLSTVISTTGVETASAISADLFEERYENASEAERARLLARRATALEAATADLEAAYQNATRAYRNSSISTSTYAQRLATLHVRAESIEESARNLQERAENVSALERSVAGYNSTALRSATETAGSLTGSGLAAISQRFTGESTASLSLDAREGVRVTAADDDGYTREFETEEDDETTLSVNQSAALRTARDALTPPANASWRLTVAELDIDDGTYEFEFDLVAANATGEAEVTIDGSAGTIVGLEETVERDGDNDEYGDERDAKDDEDDSGDEEGKSDAGDEEADGDDGDDTEDKSDDDEGSDEDDGADEIDLVVADGNVTPNGTVTLLALHHDEPVANVSVERDGQFVGRTDENGTFQLSLPAHPTRIEAGAASLSIDFDASESESRELFQAFDVDGSVANGSATMTVTYNSSGVANATVWVDDERVGRTDESGSLTVDVDNRTELDVEIVKGAFEAELEFEIQDGRLTLTETAHVGDGDNIDEDDAESDDDEDGEDDDTGVEDSDESDDEQGDDDSVDEENNDDDSADEGGVDDSDDAKDDADSSEDDGGNVDDSDDAKDDGDGSKDDEDDVDDSTDEEDEG